MMPATRTTNNLVRGLVPSYAPAADYIAVKNYPSLAVPQGFSVLGH